MSKYVVAFIIAFFTTSVVVAQMPSPTPQDKRGLGIQSSDEAKKSAADQRAREAKPALVLRSGRRRLRGDGLCKEYKHDQ